MQHRLPAGIGAMALFCAFSARVSGRAYKKETSCATFWHDTDGKTGASLLHAAPPSPGSRDLPPPPALPPLSAPQARVQGVTAQQVGPCPSGTTCPVTCCSALMSAGPCPKLAAKRGPSWQLQDVFMNEKNKIFYNIVLYIYILYIALFLDGGGEETRAI